MKFNKKMTLTAYNVKYEDLREPKPRAAHEELFIMDQKFVDALATVNLLAPDYIRDKYRKRGYCVWEVNRIKPKRTVSVDLRQLWDDAEPAPSVAALDRTGAQIMAEIGDPVVTRWHIEDDEGRILFRAATEEECKQYYEQLLKEGTAPAWCKNVPEEGSTERKYSVVDTSTGWILIDTDSEEVANQYIAQKVKAGTADADELIVIQNGADGND